MNTGTIARGVTPHQTARNHGAMLFVPSSCSSLAEKVSNISRMMKEAEDNLLEMQKLVKSRKFINSGLAIASTLQKLSLGILDVAAETLPGQAGTAAKLSLASVESADTIARYATGEYTGGEVATKLGRSGVKAFKPDTMEGVIGGYSADLHLSLAQFISGAGRRTKEAEAIRAKDMAIDLAVDNIIFNLEVVEKSGLPNAGVMAKAVSVTRSVNETYRGILAIRESYKNERSRIEQFNSLSLKQYSMMMQRLRPMLQSALISLQTCTLEYESSQK